MTRDIAEAEAAEEEESEDGAEEVAASASKKKKKKKSKKKAEAPAEVQAEPSVESPVAAAAEEEDEEAEEGAAEAGAPAAKKKKRPKKKGGAAAAEAPEQPPEVPPAAEAEEEGEEDGEEGEEAAEGAAPSKKKRRKPKKKGGGGAASAADNGPGVHKYGISDEEFDSWAKKALEATTNPSEQMSPEDLAKPPRAFWGYKYTGDLRPCFVTPQMRMPEGWLLPDYALHEEGASLSERQGQREVPILEGTALETMRMACKLGREVLDIAARFMKAGATGDQIDRVVYQACVDRKIYPSPLNYYRFPKSVCVSPNEVICHGIPDCRPIEEGDIVNLDVSIYHQGFHADLNETFFIGECDEESHKLVRTAYCSLYAAAQQIRPGTFYRDLGNYIHAETVKNACSVVTTYCGHGVGELFHGPPKIPHYRKNKAVGIMKPGHVFTVEPMINLGPDGGDRTWPDNWTAVTKNGKRSAQFEHTFLVTETGVEVLTRRQGTDPTCMPPYDPAMFQR